MFKIPNHSSWYLHKHYEKYSPCGKRYFLLLSLLSLCYRKGKTETWKPKNVSGLLFNKILLKAILFLLEHHSYGWYINSISNRIMSGIRITLRDVPCLYIKKLYSTWYKLCEESSYMLFLPSPFYTTLHIWMFYCFTECLYCCDFCLICIQNVLFEETVSDCKNYF